MSDDIFRVPFRSDFLPLSGVKYGLTFWGGGAETSTRRQCTLSVEVFHKDLKIVTVKHLFHIETEVIKSQDAVFAYNKQVGRKSL